MKYKLQFANLGKYENPHKYFTSYKVNRYATKRRFIQRTGFTELWLCVENSL